MSGAYNGMEELMRELEATAKQVSPDSCKAALAAGAEVILAEARRQAPVDTGSLRDKGLAMKVESEQEALIGWTSDGFYGRFLEDGTSKMAAKPYLRPALEAKREEANQTMLRKLNL